MTAASLRIVVGLLTLAWLGVAPSVVVAQALRAAPVKLADLATPTVDEGKLFFKEGVDRALLTFGPRDELIGASVVDSQSTFAVWNTRTGKRLTSGPDSGWAFLPDGKTVYAQWFDESFTTKLGLKYSLADNRYRIVERYKRDEFQNGKLLLSPDGRWLATTWRPVKKPKQLVVLRDGDPKKPVLLGEGSGEQFAFSPDSKLLALRDAGRIRLFDLTTKKETKFAAPGVGFVLAFCDEGRTLATGDVASGAISLSDASSGAVTQTLDVRFGDAAASAAGFSPVSRFYALGNSAGDVVIKRWGVAEEGLRFTAHEKRISAIAFSQDGATLATATEGKTDVIARLWKLEETK